MDDRTRWRAFVEAYGTAHDVATACLIDYDAAVEAGESPRAAAWVALFCYDALPLDLLLHPERMEPEADAAQPATPESEVRA